MYDQLRDQEMGRNKVVSENDILDRATETFRRHGYHAVSIKDLEQATGVRSGSLYHAYEDKDGIFRAALNHYNDRVIRHRLARYVSETDGLKGLKRLFLSLLDKSECDPDGCLLTNAAVEFGAHEAVGRTGVRQGFELLWDGFTKAVHHDFKAGRLRQGLRPEAVTWKLMTLYQGLLVLIRAGQAGPRCAEFIKREFKELEGDRDVD